MIHFGQIGIGACGGEIMRSGRVAVRGHLDAGVVQAQQAGVAVLGCDLHLSVQLLEMTSRSLVSLASVTVSV